MRSRSCPCAPSARGRWSRRWRRRRCSAPSSRAREPPALENALPAPRATTAAAPAAAIRATRIPRTTSAPSPKQPRRPRRRRASRRPAPTAVAAPAGRARVVARRCARRTRRVLPLPRRHGRGGPRRLLRTRRCSRAAGVPLATARSSLRTAAKACSGQRWGRCSGSSSDCSGGDPRPPRALPRDHRPRCRRRTAAPNDLAPACETTARATPAWTRRPSAESARHGARRPG